MLRVIAWSVVLLYFAGSVESHAAPVATGQFVPTRTPQTRLQAAATTEGHPVEQLEGAGVVVSEPSADDVLRALDAARRLAVTRRGESVASVEPAVDMAAGRPRKLRGQADAEPGEAAHGGRELQAKKSATGTGTGTGTASSTPSRSKSSSKTGRCVRGRRSYRVQRGWHCAH